MVAVMHSVGGCGATSVATHLAAALAGQEDPRGDGQGLAGRTREAWRWSISIFSSAAWPIA
jgi:hypothetical protein